MTDSYKGNLLLRIKRCSITYKSDIYSICFIIHYFSFNIISFTVKSFIFVWLRYHCFTKNEIFVGIWIR